MQRLKVMLYGVHVYAARVRKTVQAQEELEELCMAEICHGPARRAAEERVKARRKAHMLDRRDYLYARLPEPEQAAFDSYRRAGRGSHERAAALAVLTDLP